MQYNPTKVWRQIPYNHWLLIQIRVYSITFHTIKIDGDISYGTWGYVNRICTCNKLMWQNNCIGSHKQNMYQICYTMLCFDWNTQSETYLVHILMMASHPIILYSTETQHSVTCLVHILMMGSYAITQTQHRVTYLVKILMMGSNAIILTLYILRHTFCLNIPHKCLLTPPDISPYVFRMCSKPVSNLDLS